MRNRSGELSEEIAKSIANILDDLMDERWINFYNYNRIISLSEML